MASEALKRDGMPPGAEESNRLTLLVNPSARSGRLPCSAYATVICTPFTNIEKQHRHEVLFQWPWSESVDVEPASRRGIVLDPGFPHSK